MHKKILYAGLLVGAALVPTSTAMADAGTTTATPAVTAAATAVDTPWRDDFNTLDANYWRAVDRISDCYVPSGASASAGKLHLTVVKGSGACPTLNVRYNTYGKKDFGPGTMSARIKFVTAPGSWQTFWLTGGSGRDFPGNGEMDVAEIVGRDPTITHDALHSNFIRGTGRRCDQGSKQPFPVDRQYHVYSVSWSSTKVTFRIDNKVMSEYVPNGICEWPFADRQRIQFSARTGKYGGTTDFTKYPLTYDIDWVSYQPKK